jgi:phospholipid/cholesterol/gamma-HCH transport system substrate-binding protein
VTLETRNILVGAFVVVVGAVFLTFFSRGGAEATQDGYDLHAIYQSVDGVSVGTDVLLAGIKVGSVSALGYVPDGHRASVTMRIDKEIQLPLDSVALIISSGMLGGKYIKLEPGGEADVLEPGDYFEYVQGAIIFEELLQKIVLDAEARRKNARETPTVESGAQQPESNPHPFGSLLK